MRAIRKNTLSIYVLGCVLLTIVVGCLCSRVVMRRTPYRIVRGTISLEYASLMTETRIQGFSDDLLFTISQMYHIKLQIQTIPHKVTLALLDSPNIDALITFITPTVQDRYIYLFSDPFFIEAPVIVSRIGDNFPVLKDIQNKLVGVERGYLSTFDASEPLQCVFQPYDSTSDMIEALLQGKIDAVIMNSMMASDLEKGIYAHQIRINAAHMIGRSARLVVKKGPNDALIEEFNRGLKEIIANGAYKKLLDYWDLFNAPGLPN